METPYTNASTAAELLREEADRGNDRGLRLKFRFCAGGEPAAAQVQVGVEPAFDLPIEIGPPLPADTPASAPNLEVETVKANVLGWLNLALKEAARLNVPGREGMADLAMTEIQETIAAVGRYVC